MLFDGATFFDKFALPSTDVVVTGNEYASAGIRSAAGKLGRFACLRQHHERQRRQRRHPARRQYGQRDPRQQADRNGVGGISALPGATGNRFELNSMHGNGTDARDLNTPINVWPNNFSPAPFALRRERVDVVQVQPTQAARRGRLYCLRRRPWRTTMPARSSAKTVWEGDLTSGGGRTTPDSGAFSTVDVSWDSRTSRAAGMTSPEELLAAAHASCFCMALSNELAQAGTPPERLEATASVEFQPGEGVKSSHIVVRGRVPGVQQDAFSQAAEAAGEGCPVSGALKGNIDITVEATLES
jgi:osmotically inducible protein OsmC